MKSTGPSAPRLARWLPALALAVALVPASARAEGLNLAPDVGLVGANIVLFLLLIYPVNRLLVRPLLAVMDERERRTAGAEGEVDALRGEAADSHKRIEAAMLETRARAQSRRAAILAEGETDERGLLDAARADAMQAFEGVRAAVESELGSARAALETDARELAREAAERILGRAL